MPGSTSPTPTPPAPAAAGPPSADRAPAGPPTPGARLGFSLNGRPVETEDDGSSLLDLLRDRFRCLSVKDGCSPQGQCGCCTVLVDGQARVACVTPARCVAGREVVTLEGLDEPVRKRWVDAFAEAGASQCGFCTPGILMRLVAAERKTPHLDHARLDTALAAHLCRCTGWWSILDAAGLATAPTAPSRERPPRDALLGSWRAGLEGGNEQAIGPVVVEGGGGFASDAVPAGALVALCDDGRVALGVDLADARRALPKIQGRRSGIPLRHPV